MGFYLLYQHLPQIPFYNIQHPLNHVIRKLVPSSSVQVEPSYPYAAHDYKIRNAEDRKEEKKICNRGRIRLPVCFCFDDFGD